MYRARCNTPMFLSISDLTECITGIMSLAGSRANVKSSMCQIILTLNKSAQKSQNSKIVQLLEKFVKLSKANGNKIDA